MPKNWKVISSGFTLIELLIVIAVIAGLATMFISTFPASQKRSRDTARKSDLKQYQTALELYANRQPAGGYPVYTTGNTDPYSLCGTLGLTTCPQDPRNGMTGCVGGNCAYRYVSNAAGTAYSLWARLEVPTAIANPIFVICSTGVTKETNTQPTAATPCP